MARDDDSFWADIFRKFPVIATLMAIGGILGFGLGVYFIGDGRLQVLRLILCLITSTTGAGIAGGLIVGVMLDSLIGVFRNPGKKKRKQRDRPRDRIFDPD